MNDKFSSFCVIIFVVSSYLNGLSQAIWYETVDVNGQKKIQHTIPRLKRMPESFASYDFPLNNEAEKESTIITHKRAALLLDRIMVALQKAVDDGKDLKMKTYYPDQGSSLQRRGQEKGKVYWRCYFNAVTCF